MASQDTLDLVARLIGEICGVDRKLVAPEAKLVGFSIDSVRMLDLLMGVEDALDIELSENDPGLATVKTVEDFANLIEAKGSR